MKQVLGIQALTEIGKEPVNWPGIHVICTCEMGNLVVVLGDLVFENDWVIQGWTPLLNEGGFNSPTLQRGVESLHGQNYKLIELQRASSGWPVPR